MAESIDSPAAPEAEPVASATPSIRQTGYGLLRRLLLYHGLLAATLALLLMLFPKLPEFFPVGGVGDLASHTGASLQSPDQRAASNPASVPTAAPASGFDRLGHAQRLAIALLGIWLLMLPVSWVHKGIYRSSGYDHSLDETTLILPGVVASIVLVVQYSLALAFALAGIVAGVQFRRALQDTFDALFILVAIGTGIAAGIGALEVAAVMTVFFCYATVYVCCFGDGLESDFLADRKEKKRRRKADEDDDP